MGCWREGWSRAAVRASRLQPHPAPPYSPHSCSEAVLHREEHPKHVTRHPPRMRPVNGRPRVRRCSPRRVLHVACRVRWRARAPSPPLPTLPPPRTPALGHGQGLQMSSTTVRHAHAPCSVSLCPPVPMVPWIMTLWREIVYSRGHRHAFAEGVLMISRASTRACEGELFIVYL